MVNLTEVEKFYIEAHRNLKPHKISRNMRKSVTELVVDEYLLALPPEEQQKTTVSDLMSRKADKGAKSLTILGTEPMTKRQHPKGWRELMIDGFIGCDDAMH